MKSPIIDPGHGYITLDRLNKIEDGIKKAHDQESIENNTFEFGNITPSEEFIESLKVNKEFEEQDQIIKKYTKSTIIAIHMLGIACVVAMLTIAYFYYNYSLELLIIITIFGIILSLALDITLKIIVFIIKKIIEWRNNIHG